MGTNQHQENQALLLGCALWFFVDPKLAMFSAETKSYVCAAPLWEERAFEMLVLPRMDHGNRKCSLFQ